MPRNIQGSSQHRRALRETLLSSTDWMVIRHRDQLDAGFENPTLNTFEFGQLLDYRQALRDWGAGDPQDSLPGKPEWMS